MLNLRKTLSKNRSKDIMHLMVLFLLLLYSSCLEDKSSRQGKKFIKDFTTAKETPVPDTTCKDYVSFSDESCSKRCPEGTHVGDEKEVLDELDRQLQLGGDTDELQLKLEEKMTNAKGVCLADVSRPNNDIAITDYCGCLLGKPSVLNNCTGVCSGRNDTEATLFGTTSPGPSVLLNEKLGSLDAWCKAEIGDGTVKPSCVLELQNGPSVENLPITTAGNTFSVNIKEVPTNITYVATIVEVTSQARTKSFNVRKYVPQDESNMSNMPLKLMPASIYTCVTRTGSLGGDGTPYYVNAARIHFYFAQDNRPASLRPGQNFLICHDTNLYGDDDNPLYPRLEETPNHFALWDQTDLRFFDADSSGKLDINETLTKRLLNEFGVVREVNSFQPLRWPTAPANPTSATGTGTTSDSSANNSQAPLLGYFMQPWVNSQTGRGYCPGNNEYNGTDPLFRLFKEVIGVPTEGLFLAVKEEEVLNANNGQITPAPIDILMIRETQLKKIWFYYENGKYYTPNETTANQKTVMFYWPPDVTNPFVKKSTQKIYTVRSVDTLTTTANQGDLRTNVRPPDKRFGCVPAM